MKIRHVEVIPIEVPIKPRLAIRGSRGAHLVSPFLLVRIHTDEGLTGLGEVSGTPGWSGEDRVSAAHFIRTVLAPELEGEDPAGIERLTIKLGRALAAHPFTKAGVEMALWDILGKCANLPLYRLLGGAVREYVPTKWAVSGVDPGKAAEIAAWALEQGFRSMKVKVGLDPEQDLARVRAVRAAVGPGVPLGVDANGGWSVHEAIEMVRRLREFDIHFVEQPVAPLDVAWMVEVRRRIELPVLADESLYSLQDAMALARAGAADLFSIYVGKAGGIGPARKIAAVAEAAGLGCTVGSNLELGVGSAAMIHLAMATPSIRPEQIACDITGPLFYEEDILVEPLPITGGRACPSDRPGLGVELDDNKIQRYRVS